MPQDNKLKQVVKFRGSKYHSINIAFSRNIPGFLAAVEKVISHSPLVGLAKKHTQIHKHVCKHKFPSKLANYSKQDFTKCVHLIPTKYKEVHLSHRLMVPVMLVLCAAAQEIVIQTSDPSYPPLHPLGGKIHSTSECASFVLFNRVPCSRRLPAPHRDLRVLGRIRSLLPEPQPLCMLSSRPHIHTQKHTSTRLCRELLQSRGQPWDSSSSSEHESHSFCPVLLLFQAEFRSSCSSLYTEALLPKCSVFLSALNDKVV